MAQVESRDTVPLYVVSRGFGKIMKMFTVSQNAPFFSQLFSLLARDVEQNPIAHTRLQISSANI